MEYIIIIFFILGFMITKAEKENSKNREILMLLSISILILLLFIRLIIT